MLLSSSVSINYVTRARCIPDTKYTAYRLPPNLLVEPLVIDRKTLIFCLAWCLIECSVFLVSDWLGRVGHPQDKLDQTDRSLMGLVLLIARQKTLLSIIPSRHRQRASSPTTPYIFFYRFVIYRQQSSTNKVRFLQTLATKSNPRTQHKKKHEPLNLIMK